MIFHADPVGTLGRTCMEQVSQKSPQHHAMGWQPDGADERDSVLGSLGSASHPAGPLESRCPFLDWDPEPRSSAEPLLGLVFSQNCYHHEFGLEHDGESLRVQGP